MADAQRGQRRPYYNPLEKVVEQLLASNEKLAEQIVMLSLEVAKLKAQEQYIPVPMETREYPLHVPEDEEDQQFLLQHGLLDRKDIEDALAQAGFENSQITNAW